MIASEAVTYGTYDDPGARLSSTKTFRILLDDSVQFFFQNPISGMPVIPSCSD